MELEQLVLIKSLFKLRGYVDFDFLFDEKSFSHDEIKKYYKVNKYVLYRFFGSKEGFMHIGLSNDGTYKRRKGYEYTHLNEINKYINEINACNILELGCGQGPNLAYLAKLNPNRNFIGIDLLPSIDKDKKRENIKLIQGDYHNLDKIEDHSIDIVYAIETLCYSTDKNKVFKEVRRILKNDGLLIIYDGYLGKPREKLSDMELISAELVENGFCLDNFEYIGNIEKYIHKNRFKPVIIKNLKLEATPWMEAVKRRVDGYYKWGILFKLFCRLLPKKVLGNVVSAYLMSDTLKLESSVYYLHILKKK